MGTFGVDVYAQTRFGRDPSASRPDFSVQPFVSTPLDYQTLHITWANPVSPDCHQLQMVRNGLNLPQDETDGQIVFNEAVRTITSWTELQASPGFNYYTMFGCDSTSNLWVRCSDLIAILPINWGLGDRMYDLLPAMYKDQDIVLVDPYNPYPATPGVPPLQRYVSLLGFELDYLRTEMESLMSVNDSRSCSGALLPLLATELGMPYELEMGMQQARALITNAVHLYRIKGTDGGMAEYSSMLTGYPVVPVHTGNNKLLNTDDSVAAHTIGSWMPWPPTIPTGVGSQSIPVFAPVAGENVGLTLTQVPSFQALSISDSTALIGFTPPGYNVNASGQTGMAIKVTGASTADITTSRIATLDFLPVNATTTSVVNALSIADSSFEGGTVGTWSGSNSTMSNSTAFAQAGTHSLAVTTTANGNASVQTGASISVSATSSYQVSAWILPGSTVRSVRIGLAWYDSNNGFLGTSYSSSVTETSGSWLQLSLGLTQPVVGAVSARVQVFIGASVAGEVHYLDNVFLPQTVAVTHPGQTTPGNVTWTFQIYTPFGTPSRTVVASVVGDNGTQVPIVLGSSSHPTTVGQWVQMTVTAPVLPTYNADGTANYFWIYPRIQIQGMAANETHYYTFGMFWNLPPSVVSQQPAYDYPRDVKIVLEPMQTNLLANPLTTFLHGLDGLSGYSGVSGGTNTSGLTIAPVSAGQAPPAVDCAAVQPPGPPFGGHELQVAPLTTSALMWSGSVNNINTAPWTPMGWWVNPSVDSWFPGAQSGFTASKDWWDPSYNLFAVPPDATGGMSYFGTGFGQVSGQWWRQPQPSPPNNALPFSVAPLQWFTFSIYAKYLQIFSSAGAAMTIGMRWVYPDGSHIDNYETFMLTPSYDIGNGVAAPDGHLTGRYYVSFSAPYQPLTNIAPTTVLPYTAFPSANLTPPDIYALNGAMLYPGHTAPPQVPAPYMDVTVAPPGDPNYAMDTHGASYYYKRKAARVTRLQVTLSDWVPMGATYSVIYGAGAVQPPWVPV